MSRLDRLFGPTGDGRAKVGSDAELISLLQRIVTDINRLKRGAYRGPGASFRGPLIIDGYQLEFIDDALVATKIDTGTLATFNVWRRWDKAIFIGDEFMGYPPNSASWGTSPYGQPGGRWQDMLVETYRIPVHIDGTINGATGFTLFSTPRVMSQPCDLLVLCVGSHDMLSSPTSTNLGLYQDRLQILASMYPADSILIVFPWRWFSSVTNYPTEYGLVAEQVAAGLNADFVDLNDITKLSTSYVVNPASTTNSTPSLDGNQVIFAQIQAALNA